MSSLLDTLMQQIGGGSLKQIGQTIGADEKKTGAATGAALSTLLGALARNASGDEGARSLHRALEKDHDGSVLDDLGGLLSRGQTGDGDGILKHVLGGKRARVESSVARAAGLDQGSAGKLMSMLAPLVMGALGRQQRQQGLDSGSLARMLGRERQEIETRQPAAKNVLGQLLDTDGDGDVDLGDLAKHGSGLLGKLFGR